MRAWLFGIMHNLHVDALRRGRLAVVALDDDGPEAVAPPPQAARAAVLDLQAALERLPPEQREVLLLVALEDMAYADIARTLGIPPGTVMSRLSRGRERLRLLMDGAPSVPGADARAPESREMTSAVPPAAAPSDVPVTEAELHAYADRQLTPERAAEVAAWLAHRPDEARRVRSWEDDRHALRALFDPVLDEAVPPALRRAARRPHVGSPAPALAAAAALLLALATGGGWALRGAHDAPLLAAATRANDFAARAAIAHTVYAPEVKRPVEVDGAHEDQLVTWLSKRMGAAMKAPHLQSLGYALEGGRLLPGERGPVAQFMYRDEAGRG